MSKRDGPAVIGWWAGDGRSPGVERRPASALYALCRSMPRRRYGKQSALLDNGIEGTMHALARTTKMGAKPRDIEVFHTHEKVDAEVGRKSSG